MGLAVPDHAVSGSVHPDLRLYGELSEDFYNAIELLINTLRYLGWLAAASLLVLCSVVAWAVFLCWIYLFWAQTRLLGVTAKVIRIAFEVDTASFEHGESPHSEKVPRGFDGREHQAEAGAAILSRYCKELIPDAVAVEALKAEWEAAYPMHLEVANDKASRTKRNATATSSEEDQAPSLQGATLQVKAPISPLTLDEEDPFSLPQTSLPEAAAPVLAHASDEQTPGLTHGSEELAPCGSPSSSRPSSTEFVDHKEKTPAKQKQQTAEEKKNIAQTNWIAGMKRAAEANLEERTAPRRNAQPFDSNASQPSPTSFPFLKYSEEQLKEARGFLSEATPAGQKGRRPKVPTGNSSSFRSVRQRPPPKNFRSVTNVSTKDRYGQPRLPMMGLTSVQPWNPASPSVASVSGSESSGKANETTARANGAVPPHRRKIGSVTSADENRPTTPVKSNISDSKHDNSTAGDASGNSHASGTYPSTVCAIRKPIVHSPGPTDRELLFKSVAHAIKQQTQAGQRVHRDMDGGVERDRVPSDAHGEGAHLQDQSIAERAVIRDSAILTMSRAPLATIADEKKVGTGTTSMMAPQAKPELEPEAANILKSFHFEAPISPQDGRAGYQHPDLFDLDFTTYRTGTISTVVEGATPLAAVQYPCIHTLSVAQDADEYPLSPEIQQVDDQAPNKYLTISPLCEAASPYFRPGANTETDSHLGTAIADGHASAESSLSGQEQQQTRDPTMSGTSPSLVPIVKLSNTTRGKTYSAEDLLRLRYTRAAPSTGGAAYDDGRPDEQIDDAAENGMPLSVAEQHSSPAGITSTDRGAGAVLADTESAAVSSEVVGDFHLTQDGTAQHASADHDEDQVWEQKGSKRMLQERKKAARHALFVAWHVREDVRTRVAANFSLDGMKQLQKVTIEYNDRRQTLKDCMASGELNEEDSKYYPQLSLRDIARPARVPADKRKVTG